MKVLFPFLDFLLASTKYRKAMKLPASLVSLLSPIQKTLKQEVLYSIQSMPVVFLYSYNAIQKNPLYFAKITFGKDCC